MVVLLTGYLSFVHTGKSLSLRGKFHIQDETFNAVRFLLSHPVLSFPLVPRITTDIYLYTGKHTLTHFMPAQYEKNVIVNNK